MVVLNSGVQVFVHDCVTCFHTESQSVTSLVVRFFSKVAIANIILYNDLVIGYFRKLMMKYMQMFMCCLI